MAIIETVLLLWIGIVLAVILWPAMALFAVLIFLSMLLIALKLNPLIDDLCARLRGSIGEECDAKSGDVR